MWGGGYKQKTPVRRLFEPEEFHRAIANPGVPSLPSAQHL